MRSWLGQIAKIKWIDVIIELVEEIRNKLIDAICFIIIVNLFFSMTIEESTTEGKVTETSELSVVQGDFEIPDKWSDLRWPIGSASKIITPRTAMFQGSRYTVWVDGGDPFSNDTDWDIVISYGHSAPVEISQIGDVIDDCFPSLMEYNNKLYVAWSGRPSGDNQEIYIRSYDGMVWSDIDIISDTGPISRDLAPSMCVYNNELVVAWASNGNMSDGGDDDVVVRHYNGNEWSSITEVSYNNVTDYSPQMAVLGGKLFLAWDIFVISGTTPEINCCSFNGTNWTLPVGISQIGPGSRCMDPRVEVYQDSLYVVWKHEIQYLNWEICARAFDGTQWDDILPISAPDVMQCYAEIETYDGKLWIAWDRTRNVTNGRSQVMARCYNGYSWSNETNATQPENYSPEMNSMDMIDDGLRLLFIYGDEWMLFEFDYDSTPPKSDGIWNVIDIGDDGHVRIECSSAIECSYPLRCYVYMSLISGVFNFTNPFSTMENGQNTPWTLEMTNLQVGVEYFFIVRLEDSWGNLDTNNLQKSVIPTRVEDYASPYFDGLTNATNTGSGGTVLLEWNSAIDPDSLESNSDPSLPILYNIYYSTESGKQNYFTPMSNTTDLSVLISNLTDKQHYYFVVRARDNASNEENNTIELMTTPTSPPKVVHNYPNNEIILCNITIIIEFSEEMNWTSVKESFKIWPAVEIKSFEWAEKSLYINFTGLLPCETMFTYSITTNAKDIYGFRLADELNVTFTTENDFDDDGIPDTTDDDLDGDGVPNEDDAFPFNMDEWADSDGDGIGDNEDENENENEDDLPEPDEDVLPEGDANGLWDSILGIFFSVIVLLFIFLIMKVS